MAHITDRDYKKLAEAVADDLVNDNLPLNESISKLASSMDLNHEQVHRLCEATNNTAFNKLFKSTNKVASDSMVEFAVADPTEVLGSAIKTAEGPPSSSTELYELRPLPDFRHPEEPMEKAAEAPEPRAVSAFTREVDLRSVRKTRDTLHHRKLAADMAYSDGVSHLRDRFRRIYDVVPFEQFEKDAAARYGYAAVDTLNELRGLMRLPQVNYNVEVLTKVAGYVDDTTHEMQALSELIKAAGLRRNIAEGVARLEELL